MAEITFQPEACTALLLEDGKGWQPVRDLELVRVTGEVAWAKALRWRTDDLTEDRWFTAPVASVVGMQTRHVETLEERQAREAELEAQAEAQFVWTHYCDRKTYAELEAKQNGLCPKCGTLLTNARIVHAYEGQLLCHGGFKGCSPLVARWGLPDLD